MTRDVDEFMAVLDRWSDEIARAALRADALAAMTPLARLLHEDWPIKFYWASVQTPGGWARIEDPS